MIKDFIERNRKELGMAFLLLALCVWTIIGSSEEGVDALFNSRFLLPRNLYNVARQIGLYGIFSIGIGLVIITSGIDLSVGSLMALLGVFFFYTMNGHSRLPVMAWPIGIVLVLLLATSIGLLHGVLIAKFKMQAFVITLCGLLSYRGLARFFANDSAVGYTDAPKHLNIEALQSFADGKLYGMPVAFVYLLIISIVMFVVLHKSVYGRYLFAVGKNEEATRYSGINTVWVIASAYVICSLFTGFSSVLFAVYTDSVTPSTHGSFFELYAIAGAVLGGCSLRGGEGSIIGIVIGVAILMVLQNMVNLLGYESSLSDAITGGVIFLGVLADEVGIKGVKKAFSKLFSKKSEQV
jgi:ribose transport system permease protein